MGGEEREEEIHEIFNKKREKRGLELSDCPIVHP